MTIQTTKMPSPTPSPTPVPTVPIVTPEPTPAVTAVIEVKDGDTLRRDYQRPYLMTSDTKIDNEYNTYRHKGLPPGQICCFDDESLAASITEYSDKKLYFFLYDYVKKEIMPFTNYADFRAAAEESKELYESTIDSNRFVQMEDKRKYFATAG